MGLNSNIESAEWGKRLTLGLSAAKNTDYLKKKLESKVVENSIFYKKLGAHVYLHQSGVRGLKRLSCLKYYNVLKRENRLTLGLNVVKIQII